MFSTRARVGLYLGHSPMHAKSVSLVLNITTGLVSPQFHIKFDDYFETVNKPDDNLKIEWKEKCHFVDSPNTSKKSVQASEGVPNTSTNFANTNFQMDPLPTVEPPAQIPSVLQHEEGDVSNTEEIPPAIRTTGQVAEQQSVKWSKRHKPSVRLQESIEQRNLVFSSILDDIDGDEEIRRQVQMSDPIAYSASSDPDTMYMDQAMKQPDRKQFIKAMVDEVTAHTNNGHWKLILKSEVPHGTKVLPSVWAMKRKRRIATREVYKWKARLNLHGGKQEYGVNYWETYAATLAWPPIRFMLTLSIIKSWHTRQIDFTLAYPQADVECDLYMDLPKGFEVSRDNDQYCLQIIKNIYGQKQAGRTWALHLKKGLLSIGFTQSSADDCIFFRGSTI